MATILRHCTRSSKISAQSFLKGTTKPLLLNLQCRRKIQSLGRKMKILDDDEREFEKEKEIRVLNGKNSDDDDDEEDVKKDGEEEDGDGDGDGDEDEDEDEDEDDDDDDDAMGISKRCSSSSSKFGSFILHADLKRKRRMVRERESESALVMLSSESESNDDDPLVLELHNLGFPSCYKFCNDTKEIVDSCNGIVCLYDRDHNDVSLWNPSTGEFRILPKSITVDADVDRPGFAVAGPHHLVAFGFDVETKDYKVMLLTGGFQFFSTPEECIYRVQVYSLSTDSWRLLESIKHLPGNPFLDPEEGLYLNGSCFFMAEFFYFNEQPCFPESNRFIISLDLSKEIITPIQLPDHHKKHKLYLRYLGEKIALFTSAPCYEQYWMGGYEDFNIWVLNYEHGSSSSVNKGFWTKLHSFRIQLRGGPGGEYNIPRGISNDGKLVLLQDIGLSGLSNKMKLYSLVTKEVKKNFLSGKLVTSNAYAYKPSLVSIKGGNGAATADMVIINGAEAATATADRVIRNDAETKGYRVIGGAMSLLFANLTTFVCLFLKSRLKLGYRDEQQQQPIG